VRNELGTTQIQAALNAQNFDRAAQLIDEATRAKALPAAKLAQLRDEVRRRRDQTDISRLVTLIDARLQQDRLIDPRNDNAAYFLAQARQSGAPASTLQAAADEFVRRSVLAVRGAIDQHRYADADRFMAELRTNGAPSVTLAGLQRDLAAARTQPVVKKPDQPGFLDLARSRLAQGSVLEPDNDSALFYVNELRSTDPQNPGLAQITGAVQGQILGRARTALDAGDTTKAEGLLRTAGTLGTSADLDALNERLLQAKLATANTAPAPVNAIPEVPESTLKRLQSLKPDYPHQALIHNVEGWVEIAYTVTAAGKVANAKSINASPTGVFDAAALSAVAHLKYAPYQQNGKAIAVTTKIRVAFRLAGG
jgi:TonB family protein